MRTLVRCCSVGSVTIDVDRKRSTGGSMPKCILVNKQVVKRAGTNIADLKSKCCCYQSSRSSWDIVVAIMMPTCTSYKHARIQRYDLWTAPLCRKGCLNALRAEHFALKVEARGPMSLLTRPYATWTCSHQRQ